MKCLGLILLPSLRQETLSYAFVGYAFLCSSKIQFLTLLLNKLCLLTLQTDSISFPSVELNTTYQKTGSKEIDKQNSYSETKRLPPREKTSKVHTLWPKDWLPGKRKQILNLVTKRLPLREKTSKVHTLWPKDCLPGKTQAKFILWDQKTASKGKDK